MRISDKIKMMDFKGRDFPILKGDARLTLKNIILILSDILIFFLLM